MGRLLFLLACLLIWAGEATAQDPAQGLLNAVPYKPMPQSRTIFVRPMDDSDDNMLLVGLFEKELRARGYAIDPQAALVLTFEVREEISAFSSTGRRSVLELSGVSGTSSGNDSQQVRVNLFDSSRGGLLNRGQETETSITTPGSTRMDVTVDDRQANERLWQSWAKADLGRFNALDLSRAMIPVVVAEIGNKVRRQPFKIR